MPIYEYRCESCGKELEKIQKFSDPPLRECPACGKETLQKLVSASSFRLKGSGWYVTDFKDKKKPSESNSDGKKAESGKDTDSGTAADSDKSSKGEKGGDSGSAKSTDKKTD